ncbi:hypothetical protein NEAUS03_1908 [Nematocida ausubeli]|nr:hypothetical protein NEAUS03_1908 [Nematocida ausubeli]
MKAHSSVIWIKAVTLISVLLVSTHRADITLNEIETTLQFEMATNATPIRINPEGPLNFLRGYIYQKMECMYNKRFFSPQIKTDYLLKENPRSGIFVIYTYNRNRHMDKAYKALSASEMDVYTEKYHTHLIDLFPSPTGDITIETRGNQSFIQFLRAETTEKHALQILAMLLLFSEGVDIPIEVSNKALKVYETDKKDEKYFEVTMAIPWLNTKKDKVETFPQKKAKQIIKFFQENATNREVLSLMMDKCSKEEVISGKFLDSPKFLIQSYIFRFIDTVERAKEFIQTVHIMTEKYAPKTEAPSKGECVYDRLFKPDSTVTGTEYMTLMKKAQEILNTYRVFPFADSTQIPSYTSVPRYSRKAKLFSTNHLQDYSNCVECMIFSLFCCLAYDPNDFTYKTNHMGNVSEELEEFFSPEENKSFDTKKADFQKKWCTVVADLDEPSITYCRNRNELECGLINMLMVIAEIVNISEDEKRKILGFSDSLNESRGELKDKLSNDIKEYTKTLLKRLSKTENIEIEFSELRSNKCSNGRYDVYGEITMSFEKSRIKNTIVLEISKSHSAIDMEPAFMDFEDNRMEKLSKLGGSCKSGKEFVGNLFSIYVDYEIRKIDTPEKKKEFMKTQVRKTIENSFADINRLLLTEKINNLEYKKELITRSIVCSMDQKLYPEHPIVRFTSNLLGSTELDNTFIQSQVLPSVICAGLTNKNSSSLNYPNINLPEKVYEIIMTNIKNYWFVDYVLECDVSIFIIWIKYCIDNFNAYNGKGVYELFDYSVLKYICKYIFKDENMKYANAVGEAIARDYPEKKDVIISDLHYTWFMYLILQEIPNIELIKANFDAIQTSNYISSSFIYYYNQEITQALAKLKDQLCSDTKCIAKFGELMRKYSLDPTTS